MELRLLDVSPEWIEDANAWMDRSKCGTDPNWREWQTQNREDQFFDEIAASFKGHGASAESSMKVRRAKEYCSGCPVRTECLNHALKYNETGIWAGTTERERRSKKKKAHKVALEWLERLKVQLPDGEDPNVA